MQITCKQKDFVNTLKEKIKVNIMICILKVIHYFYNTLYYYVFKIFRKLCLKIYELDPAKFLSDPGLALQAALKKSEVKLKLLSNINMLLMVEKRIRGGICHAIH